MVFMRQKGLREVFLQTFFGRGCPGRNPAWLSDPRFESVVTTNKFKFKNPLVNWAYIIISYGFPGCYETHPSVQLGLYWEKAVTGRGLELNRRLCAQWALCSPSFVSSTTVAGQCQGKYCMKNSLENPQYFCKGPNLPIPLEMPIQIPVCVLSPECQ